MEQGDWTSILTALKSINHSLDERFEKDASLYVSMEDADKLKNLIFAGQYKQIVDKLAFKQFSPEALANVVIRNAWLIQDPASKKCKMLRKIFEDCDFQYLSSIMQDGVFENKIEMPTEFRILLLRVFMERADALTCGQMLEQDIKFLNNVELRAVCVRQALKEQPILERYMNFRGYVQRWEQLLTQDKILAGLFTPNELQLNNAVKDEIFNNELCKNTAACDFWIDCLGADNAEYIFIKFRDYCRANSSNVGNITPWLLNMFNLARKEPTSGIPLFARYFAEACACMDARAKRTLAQNGINKTRDSETEIFQNALTNHGISMERGDLADLEEIIETFSSPWFERKLNYLVLSFKKKYGKQYEAKLGEIRAEVNGERFKQFCFRLIEHTDNIPAVNIKYLLYFIETVLPPAVLKTDSWVQKFLRYIRNKAILTSPAYRGLDGLDRVRNFVREKDYALFAELTGM